MRSAGIPTAPDGSQLLSEADLPIVELASATEGLDVAIDGADEVDRALHCIKGGGAAHLEERLVASAARRFVIIADSRKMSERLGTKWTRGVPLEVAPSGWRLAQRLLLASGRAETAELRMAKCKAGPVVTDGGHFVIDAHLGGIEDPAGTDAWLRSVPGVLETGLFAAMATEAVFGMPSGAVETWSSESNRTASAE